MFIATVKVKSLSPIGFSKPVDSKKESNESHEEFELRTWREKAHYDENNHVLIPGIMFKKSFEGAADFNLEKVEGNTKFKKFLQSSVFVVTPFIKLSTLKEDVKNEKLFVPSDGKKGGGSRVWKHFPVIEEWEGTIIYRCVSDVITQPIFEKTLKMAGQVIGIGRWRPRNGGLYGMYDIEDITWETID